MRVLNLGTGTKPRNVDVSNWKEIPFCFFSFFCLGENYVVQFLNKKWNQIFSSWELFAFDFIFTNQGTCKLWSSDSWWTSHASRADEISRMVKSIEMLWVWAEKAPAVCHLSCKVSKLSFAAAPYWAGRLLKEPGFYFWDVASSDTLHMQMCRTLCFAGLQIRTLSNLDEFLSSTFPQQHNSCPAPSSCVWRFLALQNGKYVK